MTDVLVCHCAVVNEQRICDAIAAGACDVDAIGDDCLAGTGCGNCHPVIERLITQNGPTARREMHKRATPVLCTRG